MKQHIPLFLILLFAGCALIDFSSDENAVSNPSAENQVIGESEHIYVSFSFAPEKISAETLFKISDCNGNIEGELEWDDRKLYFIPAEKMKQGRRYTLSFCGEVEKKDGGNTRIEILIPFYFIERYASVPFITGISPAGGSVIGREDTVTVSFSKSIDTGSFKKGFSVSPEKEHTLSWENSNTQVVIAPLEKWENLTSYCFSFSSDICCTEAIPFEKEEEITLYVDNSHVNPYVVSTETAMRDVSSAFPPLSPDLNSIKYNDPVRIVFYGDMDRESVESAFSINPFIAGRKLWIDNKTLIFLPESFWRWENEYNLSISPSAESEDGIKMAGEYTEDFTADIDELKLFTLDGKAGDGFPVNTYSESTFIEIETDPVAPYTYTFTFVFSGIFASDQEKLKAQDFINISCIFPPEGSSPFPVMYSWLSDSSLTVKYSGFTPYDSAGNIYYYYLLKIKGGDAGIINNTGNYLSGDIKQLLRTK